ncbi:hypothetical protein [Candidatus Nanosyncoccus nanoralicus]|uniref:Transmembrane protein n=1 Tax=Candidatus Nanosyncoccus nanoralicus TaxID=2171996 RepID=A0ABY0FLR1_9BACT|nr:hypothetical protein [Candidatus Nanosyncoccus nanoralicus]RYC73281.1 hypothetical protein G3KMM_00465 [Candidatus Nanosyncoccus nanoralicus]
MTVKILVLVILSLNVATAAIYKFYRLLSENDSERFIHVKQFVFKSIKNEAADENNTITNYFLAHGFLNDPILSFVFLDKLFKPNCHLYYMQYDNFGYDAEAYTNQLYDKVSVITKEASKAGKKVENTAISISLGDQIVAPIEEVFDQVITINPCTYNCFINQKYRTIIAFCAPILFALEYGLGWLSFIPFISYGHNYYSITLIADQIYDMKHIKPSESIRLKNQPRKILLSRFDQFLDNRAIETYYPQADIQYVNCEHGTMSDPNDAQLYLLGVQKLFGQSKVTDYPYPWERKVVR